MPFPSTCLAAASFPYWPFVVLALSITFVILSISALRLHPFLALIGAALLTGVLSSSLPPTSRTSTKANGSAPSNSSAKASAKPRAISASSSAWPPSSASA